jgi:membrane protein
MSTTLFAMIYKFMPRARIAWSDVWIGAVVTAVLFEAGKFLIGVYLGKAGITSGFGAAGSLVVLIVWVYYSAQIFLLGAEFTWVYARAHGSHSSSIATTDEAATALPTEKKSTEIPSRGTQSPVAINAPATSAAPAQSRKTSVTLFIASAVLLALTGLLATLSAERERYR